MNIIQRAQELRNSLFGSTEKQNPSFEGLKPLASALESIKRGGVNRITVKNTQPQFTDPTEKLHFTASEVQKKFPELPANILNAVLAKESSSGKDKANEKYDVGKFGWLVGFTKTAAKEFDRLKIPYNADTEEGALKAGADYLKLMSQRHKTTDPIELYKHYNAAGNPGVISKFKQVYGEYSNSH